MGIFYICTILLLGFTFLLVKKSNSKLNLITWIVITTILLFAYNTFISYFFNLINIKCNLLNLGIVNSIISISILVYSIVKNNFQKYFVNKKEMLVLFLLLIFVVGICKINYKSFDSIKYETTDPAAHFMASLEFYRNSCLLNKIEQNEVYDYATMMPSSYINTGILFKIISTFGVDEINFYKAYIFIDCIMLYLSSVTFYCLIKRYFKGIEKSLISIFITVLFTFGYPLTSAIFGFAYLSLGLIFIEGIILCINILRKNNFSYVQKLIIMFLLTFGLFFSYYFFAPVVFASIGIYLLIHYIKNKKIFTIKNIVEVFVVLGIPCICGFCYFILPSIVSPETTFAYGNAIKQEGHIYRDLYSNFLVLAPFTIYYFIKMLKRKSCKLENIITVLLVIFAAILFCGGMMRKSFFVLFL